MFGITLWDILIGIPTTLIALSVHEWAHGFVSYKLGDPTPKAEGRLTLNPLAHLDPIGTLLMVVTKFGWAKPVHINPMYYKDRVKGMALTALAGPLSNFILAFLSIILMWVCEILNAPSILVQILYVFAIRNLCFMVFNLIPFPPLDGFKIAGVIIPRNLYYKILGYEQYIMYLLMFLSLSGVFSNFIGNGVNFVFWFLLEKTGMVFQFFM